MAIQTPCQTPSTHFHTEIGPKSVKVEIQLPKVLSLDEEEAKLLENNIHNALELVFAKYF